MAIECVSEGTRRHVSVFFVVISVGPVLGSNFGRFGPTSNMCTGVPARARARDVFEVGGDRSFPAIRSHVFALSEKDTQRVSSNGKRDVSHALHSASRLSHT